MGIVPRFNKSEDGHARLGLRAESAPCQQLAFQRGEEALAHRVIVAIGDRAHRGADAAWYAASVRAVLSSRMNGTPSGAKAA